MKIPAIVLVIGAALVLVAQASMAQPFNQVIIFGDSNVDSGYYKALSSPGGGATFNSLWPSAVAHGAGAPTTSPGLENSQFLAAFFGLTANPSNTMGGTNYATSGAKNTTVNNTQTGGFTAAVPTVTQISNYLTANGGSANSQALYLIHSGDNDVKYANGETGTGPYPPDPNAYMTQAANDLANAISTLKTAGATSIIVTGLEYDFGNSADKALKLLYTNTLWSQLTTLGVPFFKGDIDKVRKAISANPANYGFTSISNTAGNVACTQPSGVTTAWALLCSSDPAAPSTLTSPMAPQTDLFADDQHLATAGQQLMANYLYRLIVPQTDTHDFNGDGKSDIALKDTSGDVAMWLMNGSTISSAASLGQISTAWSIVGQRDFNDDGKADLLWRDTSGNVAMWFMNGTSISSTASIGNVSTAWSVAGTGDFNGDGKGDILWLDNSGNVAIWLMNGSTITSAVNLGNVGTSWQVVGTGDFNGDGYTDILWRDSSGNLAMWFMNGTSIEGASSLGNVSTVWSVAATGDFNGDGQADILWRDNSGDLAMWLMQGSGITTAVGLGTISTAWNKVGTGDFNGDGKSDILWEDTSGDLAIWFMNGTTISSAVGLGTISNVWSIQTQGAE